MEKTELSTVGERLKYYIEMVLGLAIADYTIKIGLPPKTNTISNYTKNKYPINGKQLKRMLAYRENDFPQEWILFNKGEVPKMTIDQFIDDSMEKPEKPMKLQSMKKPKKPVTLARQKELEASCARMQQVRSDFQMNNISKLERHLGVTHGLISNVLDMRNVISDITAEALKKYGYSYEWVMYGTEPKMKPKEIPVKIESNEIRVIQTSECKLCIANERTIIAQDRTIKLLEAENEKLKKRLEKRRLGGSGTIPKSIPETG